MSQNSNFNDIPLYTACVNLLFVLLIGTSLSAQTNYLNKGNGALRSGDYAAAEAFYQDAIEHCDENAKANLNLATLAAESGDENEALRILEKCIKNDKSANAYYNRALIYLKKEDYENAMADLRMAKNSKEIYTGQLEREAHQFKRTTEEKELLIQNKLGDKYLESGHYDLALNHYDQALGLSKNDSYFLFKKALVGLEQKNPFVALENAEAINYSQINESKRIEVDLIKAHSLGRINRMKEAVALLEDLIFYKKYKDVRLRKLLSYYYLKLNKYDEALQLLKVQAYEDANTYLIAGNAAFYSRNFTLASRCFERALYFDPQNVNAEIGQSLSLANKNEYTEAIRIIDALADQHPDNFRVLNTKGIVYKDQGLFYKNRFSDEKSKAFFRTAAAAFLSAQIANKSLKASFENNRALALFFLNEINEAKAVWMTNKELSSENNLALCYASERDYKKAYHKLNSLADNYRSQQKKKHSIVEYNKNLARSKTRLNNNYKFITNYFLTQDKPILEVENPFTYTSGQMEDVSTPDYILAYSDKDCYQPKQTDRKKKKKKKKKFKLFKKKKKKQKGDCPTF